MKFLPYNHLAAFAILSQGISGFPLLFARNALVLRSPLPQAYSVVPVDGGASPTSAGATMTVTDLLTSTSISILSATPNPRIVSTATVVETPSPVTVTIQPVVTSEPYDNGQWHTTYWFKTTIVPSVEQSTVTSAAAFYSSSLASNTPAPTTTSAIIDPGQWSAWANVDGGARDGQWQGQQ